MYRQKNKKRIDPRYFLHETAEHETVITEARIKPEHVKALADFIKKSKKEIKNLDKAIKKLKKTIEKQVEDLEKIYDEAWDALDSSITGGRPRPATSGEPPIGDLTLAMAARDAKNGIRSSRVKLKTAEKQVYEKHKDISQAERGDPLPSKVPTKTTKARIKVKKDRSPAYLSKASARRLAYLWVDVSTVGLGKLFRVLISKEPGYLKKAKSWLDATQVHGKHHAVFQGKLHDLDAVDSDLVDIPKPRLHLTAPAGGGRVRNTGPTTAPESAEAAASRRQEYVTSKRNEIRLMIEEMDYQAVRKALKEFETLLGDSKTPLTIEKLEKLTQKYFKEWLEFHNAPWPARSTLGAYTINPLVFATMGLIALSTTAAAGTATFMGLVYGLMALVFKYVPNVDGIDAKRAALDACAAAEWQPAACRLLEPHLEDVQDHPAVFDDLVIGAGEGEGEGEGTLEEKLRVPRGGCTFGAPAACPEFDNTQPGTHEFPQGCCEKKKGLSLGPRISLNSPGQDIACDIGEQFDFVRNTTSGIYVIPVNGEELHFDLACPSAWLSPHSPIAKELAGERRSDSDSQAIDPEKEGLPSRMVQPMRETLSRETLSRAIQEFIDDNMSTSMFFGWIPENPCIHIVQTTTPNCNPKEETITSQQASANKTIKKITASAVLENPCPTPTKGHSGEKASRINCKQGSNARCKPCASGYACYALSKHSSKVAMFSIRTKDLDANKKLIATGNVRSNCLSIKRVNNGDYDKIEKPVKEHLREVKKIKIKMKRGTK